MNILKNNNEKYFNIFAISIFLIIPIVLYGKIYLMGLTLGGDDFLQYFINEKYFGQKIFSGIFPQWNSYFSAGTHQITCSSFYIINIILSVFSLRNFVFLFFLFHLSIGGIAFYFYLKEKGCQSIVSFIFAIIFETSIQINGYRKGHPQIIAAICIFPLIMLCVKKFYNTEKKEWLFLSAIITALQTSAFIQYGIYATIILFFNYVYILIEKKVNATKGLFLSFGWLLFYIGALSFCALPILSILEEYRCFGSSSTDFATFSSFSMHPIKILMIIYPNIFGTNVLQPLGSRYSSEMDIEIFFGTYVFILFITFLSTHIEEKNKKVELLCLIISFLYMGIAHVPLLRQVVFHIPIINGFRCSGRFLYLFNFFYLSLAASGLNQLELENKNKFYNNLGNSAKSVFIISLLLAIVVFAIHWNFDSTTQHRAFYLSKHIFIRPIIISFVVLILSYLYVFAKINNNKYFKIFLSKKLLLLSLIVATFAEVLPYSIKTASIKWPNNSTESISKKMIIEDKNYKIWDAFASVDGAHQSIISQSKNLINEISAINSYIPFNNPNIVKYFDNLGMGINNIPFNLSGLMTGSRKAADIVKYKKDLLSMLGIKYIIDSSGVINKTNGNVIVQANNPIQFHCIKSLNIVNFQRNIAIENISLSNIDSNKFYKFEFDYSFDNQSKVSYFSVDLYGGPDYDFADQEYPILLDNRKSGHAIGYLYSSNISRATKPITMRIIIKDKKHYPVSITNLIISEIDSQKGYDYFSLDDNNVEIYKNNDACPLIYSPKTINQIEDWDNLYTSMGEYELDRDVYLENATYRSVFPSKISNINIKTNSVSANVETDEDSYICFSQCYSKYWKLKVDGVAQKIDFVNGLIMGSNISKGNHSIVFYYFNPVYIIGIVVSIITVSIIFILFRIQINKEK